MIDNEHLINLNKTGDWIINRARQLLLEATLKGKISKKLTYQWKELHGRMNQFQKDMKKVTDEGEEWKNEN